MKEPCFVSNPNEDMAENGPVRVVDAVVESLDLKEFKKLYRERGRSPYHPKMMLKIINRFRYRIKKEINNIFTQVVLLLADRGFITLDVEYVDGTKLPNRIGPAAELKNLWACKCNSGDTMNGCHRCGLCSTGYN